MLNRFPFALIVGAVLGYLAGLGVGGGSLLILWLTLILQITYADARLINLLFFITGAGTVCLVRWKQGSLPFRKILPAVLAGVVTAGISAWIGTAVDVSILKKPFGILLLVTGLRELFYRPRKER